MIIQSAFQSSGVPATGLTPAITVYDLSDDSVDVNAQTMTAVANGIYKYDFTTYDSSKSYGIYVDGGETLDNTDRYQYGSNMGETTTTWAVATSTLTGAGTIGKHTASKLLTKTTFRGEK